MPSEFAMAELARLVQTKRGNSGLREVAHTIGVSPSTLSRIEQGKIPDLDTFVKLCNWLEIAPDKFFPSGGTITEHEASRRVIPAGASTPDVIEVHLRADKELDPETAEALAAMVRAAYKAVVDGKLGRGRHG